MKLSFLLGAATGYVLGAKAGRDRYETIVRVARRLGGSQTVQTTRGVLQAKGTSMRHQVQHAIGRKLTQSGMGSTTNSYQAQPPPHQTP
jgi:hypothetical protein